MTYFRVVPRDLFNEAKLLKCLGVVALNIHDGLLHNFSIEEDGERFLIELDEDNSELYVRNFIVTRKDTKQRITFSTPYNSKLAFPLYYRVQGEEDQNEVLMQDGMFREDFLTATKNGHAFKDLTGFKG